MYDWKKHFTTEKIVQYTGIFLVVDAIFLLVIDVLVYIVSPQGLESSGILTIWSLLIMASVTVGFLISAPALAIGHVTVMPFGVGLLLLMILGIASFIIASFFRVPIVGIPWVRIALVLWFVLIVWQSMNLVFDSWCQVKGTCVQSMYSSEEVKELKVTKMFREKFPEYRYVEDMTHGYTLRVYANSNEKTHLDIPLRGEEPVLYCLIDEQSSETKLYTSQKSIREALKSNFCH